MGISGDMGLRRAVIIIFIIALLPLSILEVKADSNIGYQELVEVEVNSADTVEMENARYNRLFREIVSELYFKIRSR